MKNLQRLALLGALLSGCLPKDTRPPPSRVRFTVSPSAETKAGALANPTADGWDISFARVLISIGRASLDGDECSVYSEADYGRVLNLIGAPDRPKISESYAIGTCDFGFGIANAGDDSLLGAGTTEADKTFLRTAGTDHYGGPSGISLYVSGAAKKADRRVTFAWPFRGRARYRECQNTVEGVVKRGLLLSQDGDVTLDVAIHAEALFVESLGDPDAALRFDPIASADELGDADGDVTLDELSQVPLGDLQRGTAYTQDDAGVGVWSSLEDFIYLGTAPAIARFEETGKCTLQRGERRGD